MKILAVIPARYASTRFPGKPLVDIRGKSMIQRVYEQTAKAEIPESVIVATDDSRIAEHVQSWGGRVAMTSSEHPSGTDRIIEVAGKFSDYDAYINVQGDEPFIDPRQINQLAEILKQQHGAYAATLVKSDNSNDFLENPNTVKVVFRENMQAMYFSRSPIPYLRNQEEKATFIEERGWYRHIGIYGYSRSGLKEIAGMKRGKLEKTESLEQLRWLENGLTIYVGITPYETQAVDTPEDLAKITG